MLLILALILTAKLLSSAQPLFQSEVIPASSASTEVDVINVIAKASASVIQIEVTYQIKPWFGRQQTFSAKGSGFVISTDSHCHVSLITNSHVLNFYEMAAVEQRLFTKLVGYTLKVKTPAGLPVAISEVYDHREHDAALLIAEDACDALPALTVAKQAAQVGDEAIALGYPLGMPLQASKGIVSSLVDRDIGTDAAIHPGSSGGPLLNRQGEVIGITTYGITESAAINFAQSIVHLTDTQDYVAVDVSSIGRLRRYLTQTYR